MSSITGKQQGPPRTTPLCPRTHKPIEVCCVGHPWSVMRSDLDFRTWGEPLPQIVIDVAAEHGLEPHVLMDDVEDRGWETHDKGFDEQVCLGAIRISEDLWWTFVGGMVATHRRARRFIQDDLALSVGMVRSSIANLERGKQRVSAWALAKIALRLDLSLCHLTPCEHHRRENGANR